MAFTLIGHPIAATIAGVALGSTTGFFVADSGLIDFGGGIWNDKLVTGVAYGATIGAVPGVMTGMGNPAMGKARRREEAKAEQARKAQQDNAYETRNDDSPTPRMHPDDAQDFEDFKSWRAYVREREAARYEREQFGSY